MPSTVALQMNGLGFWFQDCINASIACFRSGTLTKLPHRIASRSILYTSVPPNSASLNWSAQSGLQSGRSNLIFNRGRSQVFVVFAYIAFSPRGRGTAGSSHATCPHRPEDATCWRRRRRFAHGARLCCEPRHCQPLLVSVRIPNTKTQRQK